ncbi:MAG: DUF6690 family protein [Planctomycetota bacterium]
MRTVLFSILIFGILALPFLLTEEQPRAAQNRDNFSDQNADSQWSNNPFQQASSRVNIHTASVGDPQNQWNQGLVQPIVNPATIENQTPIQNQPRAFSGNLTAINQPGIETSFSGTPDFGRAQTFYLPGDLNGPDFSAQPVGFIPIQNLAEIFRFNISPKLVRQQWERVSLVPSEDSLHGMRVALVTGTNSWDLHGSLTYYFDTSQRCQRISFRGWTGDETRLIQLLTQSLGFSPRQTHLAGFYVAEKGRKTTGAMLMRYPEVIYRNNSSQQLALVLEINNQDGPFSLSRDFYSLILGSQKTQ